MKKSILIILFLFPFLSNAQISAAKKARYEFLSDSLQKEWIESICKEKGSKVTRIVSTRTYTSIFFIEDGKEKQSVIYNQPVYWNSRKESMHWTIRK